MAGKSKLTKAQRKKALEDRKAKTEQKKIKKEKLLFKCQVFLDYFKNNLKNLKALVTSFVHFNLEIVRQINQSNKDTAINNFLTNWFGMYLEVKYQYYLCKYGVILLVCRDYEIHRLCYDNRDSRFENICDRVGGQTYDDNFRRNSQTVACSEFGVNNFLSYGLSKVRILILCIKI
jgi:hypothetical protein